MWDSENTQQIRAASKNRDVDRQVSRTLVLHLVQTDGFQAAVIPLSCEVAGGTVGRLMHEQSHGVILLLLSIIVRLSRSLIINRILPATPKPRQEMPELLAERMTTIF